MAPPSTKPLLSSIATDALGAQVHQQILDHLGRLAVRIGYTMRETGPSDLALTVTDLARYAQTGDGDPDDVPDQILDVCQALYGIPGAAVDLGDADPGTAIGVVILAATARHAIEHGDDVGTGELAALASLSPRHLALLASQGEIKSSGTRGRELLFSAKESRRWLSGRGVPGFAKKR